MQIPEIKSFHPMLSLCMLCMLMLVIFPAIAADRISGVIINFRGMAHIVHGDSRQTVKRGLRVMVGDQILTGDNARVAIKMIDDAILILGSNTQFHIRQYNYASQARQGSASLELLKGALRSITGLIGEAGSRERPARQSHAREPVSWRLFRHCVPRNDDTSEDP